MSGCQLHKGLEFRRGVWAGDTLLAACRWYFRPWNWVRSSREGIRKRPKKKTLQLSRVIRSGRRGGTSKGDWEGMPSEEEETQERVCPGSKVKKLFQSRGRNQLCQMLLTHTYAEAWELTDGPIKVQSLASLKRAVSMKHSWETHVWSKF